MYIVAAFEHIDQTPESNIELLSYIIIVCIIEFEAVTLIFPLFLVTACLKLA